MHLLSLTALLMLVTMTLCAPTKPSDAPEAAASVSAGADAAASVQPTVDASAQPEKKSDEEEGATTAGAEEKKENPTPAGGDAAGGDATGASTEAAKPGDEAATAASETAKPGDEGSASDSTSGPSDATGDTAAPQNVGVTPNNAESAAEAQAESETKNLVHLAGSTIWVASVVLMLI